MARLRGRGSTSRGKVEEKRVTGVTQALVRSLKAAQFLLVVNTVNIFCDTQLFPVGKFSLCLNTYRRAQLQWVGIQGFVEG